jgi:hypothetical protein
MNCQRFEDIVGDIAREQILDVRVRNEAIAHGRECAPCGLKLEDELMLTLRLRNFAGSFESIGASTQLEARLLAALGDRSRVKSDPALISRPRYWIAAIAAVLVVVFAFALFRARQTTPENGNARDVLTVQVPASAATVLSPVVSAPSKDDSNHRSPLRLTPIRHNLSSARSNTNRSKLGANSEMTTDFIPVTYGGAASLSDGGRMVRVELPRSAMASFGLPINVDRANEKIKADVLLGVDGLAHAIRFVR